MKNTRTTLLLALLMSGATIHSRAADETAPAASTPNRAELREKMKNMTPEERSAAMKEWREKHPEAAAKVKEAQERRANSKDLTPEEREAKLKERRATAEARVADLQKKKTAGTITEQESKQLVRLEQMLKARPPGQNKRQAGAIKATTNPGDTEPAPTK